MGKSTKIKDHRSYVYDCKKSFALKRKTMSENLEARLQEIENDIIHDFYADARSKLLNLSKDGINELVWRMQASLEMQEYNFKKAENLLDKSENMDRIRQKALNDITLKRGLIYFTKGEFDIAEGYFAELLCYPTDYFFGFKYLLFIEIIKGHYHNAKKILDKIAPIWNNERFVNKLYGIINLNLGLDVPDSFSNTYLDNRLSSSDIKTLVENLRLRFLNGINNPVYIKKFTKDTDFYDLVAYAIEKMKEVPKSYSEIYSRYIIQSDEIKGFVKNSPTTDICVKTFGPADKIITIEPIQLSKNFNREGYSLTRKK